MSLFAMIMNWEIRLADTSGAAQQAFPSAILTPGGPDREQRLPPEIGSLLPVGFDDQNDPEIVIVPHGDCSARGIFMANPFLNLPLVSERLCNADIEWVCNLPSVAQHDDEFLELLEDVALGFERELEQMVQFISKGFRVIATVSSAEQARGAVACGVDALFVLPQVADFASGFPSGRFRDDLLQKVSVAIEGHKIPLLSLVTEAEAGLPATWPKSAAGVILRPVPLS